MKDVSFDETRQGFWEEGIGRNLSCYDNTSRVMDLTRKTRFKSPFNHRICWMTFRAVILSSRWPYWEWNWKSASSGPRSAEIYMHVVWIKVIPPKINAIFVPNKAGQIFLPYNYAVSELMPRLYLGKANLELCLKMFVCFDHHFHLRHVCFSWLPSTFGPCHFSTPLLAERREKAKNKNKINPSQVIKFHRLVVISVPFNGRERRRWGTGLSLNKDIYERWQFSNISILDKALSVTQRNVTKLEESAANVYFIRTCPISNDHLTVLGLLALLIGSWHCVCMDQSKEL